MSVANLNVSIKLGGPSVTMGRTHVPLIKYNKVIIVILGLLALCGLAGAILMFIRPDDALLVHTSGKDYFWSGFLLFIVMGAWPLLNIFAVAKEKAWAEKSVAWLGGVSVLWIMYEATIMAVTIRAFSLLQPVVILIGLSLIFLAVKQYLTNSFINGLRRGAYLDT
ncbi:MAG: hypothetical protein ACMG55_09695 [Microcoleus sp.]